MAKKYLCQAPKEFDDQRAAFRKKHTLDGLLAAGYWVQPKYDGCHMLVNTQDGKAYSRTGETCLAADNILANLRRVVATNDWVIFGEFWAEGKSFSEISGDFRRFAPAPDDTVFVMYDAVPINAFKDGECSMTYEERFSYVAGWGAVAEIMGLPRLRSTSNFTDQRTPALELARAYKEAGGFDGIILRDPNAGWAPGAAKDGEVIKVKPVYSLDLKVLGSSVVKRATKLGGFITCDLGGGVHVDVGSGLTQNMLDGIRIDPEIFNGMIAEIEFMGYTNDGSLREPRFKGFRHDKEQADR